ncbi:hypothetical protein HME9302_00172 [Alteripontixanthobacter maritimus]|uniref:DUF924 domain-containing protein n=1 Tax=Alteripontixanthobacter maritimus TaxID=2161824 RepID=A0A369Q658_9SPHN|nr:DUF924 family protein [Alteripontixanthobacter maritimus]RDC58995.1 hypothetical protein HME9302_00172 [Alteripontixanthobacter maritimus]
MIDTSRRWADEILYVWFHRLTPSDWFVPRDAVDAMLEQRFENDLHALGTRRAQDFMQSRRTARAAILVFDQVPRNLYRGTAAAFAWDDLAKDLCEMTLVRWGTAGLSRMERQFLLMPLMHSEDIAAQEASLRWFAQPGNRGALAFARSHHRMIARFGRFPHRNEALGRNSTPAEERAVARGFSW